MAVDLTGSGIASASSEWNASHSADKAVDDNNSTQWAGNGLGFPYWWKYDFGVGNAEIINQYTIRARNDADWEEIPSDWTFEGSNDDSIWDVLDTQSNVIWSQAELKTFTGLANTTAYRYYRILITASTQGIGSNTSFAEIELMLIGIESIEDINTDIRISINESINDISTDIRATVLPLFGEGWLYRKKITIDSSQISSDLTDYPLLVELDNTNFDFTKSFNHGNDIRFIAADELTPLNFEREDHLITLSDLSIGGIATTSSAISTSLAIGAGNPADAFDKNTATFISTFPDTTPEWVKYDVGSGNEKVAIEYSIIPRTSNANGRLQDWTFEGSNDDSIWDVLDTQVGQTWVDDTPIHYKFSNKTSYRYYRWNITSAVGNYIQVREFQIYEATSGGSAVYHVRIPNVSSTIDTDIWMYYGNDSANNASTINDVWNSNFKAVWHLKEFGNFITDEFKDSTSNNHHGTGGKGFGPSEVPIRSLSKIGYGQDFDGIDDVIGVTDHPDFSFGTNDLTISAWVTFDNITGNQNIFGQIESAGNYFYCALEGGNFRFRDFTGSDNINFSSAWPALSTGVDYYITVVKNAGTFTFYINGVSLGTTTGTFTDRTGDVQIGNQTDISYNFNGKIDEIRISTGVDRGTSWMGADISGSSLLTFGIEDPFIKFKDIDTDIRIANPPLSGWFFKRKYTIDSTKIDSNLTNYTAMVKLTSFNFDFSKAELDLKDVRFSKGDQATLIEHQLAKKGTFTDSYDVATGGIITASSVDGTDIALNAFDENLDTFWSSDTVSILPQWLKYDLGLGNEKIVTIYSISSNYTDINGKPQDWTFEGSNDNSIWDTLDTRIAQVFTSEESIEYSFSNTTAYRYYRLNITNSSGGSYVQIKELKLLVDITGTIAYYWVKIPEVSSTADTDIYVFYGNTSVGDSGSTDAWDSNFKQVYHFSESGTGLSDEFKDSTANALHGTGGNGLVGNTPTRVVGDIGYEQSYDGIDDFIQISDNPILDWGTSDLTISIKVNFNSISGSSKGIIARETSGGSYFYLAYESGSLRFRDFGGTIDFQETWSPIINRWYRLTITRNGSNFKIFIDDNQLGATYVNADSFIDRVEPLWIGKRFTSSDYFDGLIDELRISVGTDRGDAWRVADKWSYADKLFTYGSEESNIVSVISDVDTDIRVDFQTNIDDLNTDVHVRVETIVDTNTDIRVDFPFFYGNINTNITIRQTKFEDINTDIRIKHTENIEDVNTDVRIFLPEFENINTDIRVDEYSFEDINTDIRTNTFSFEDINTNITVMDFNVDDINTDIRTKLIIPTSAVVFDEPIFIEEGLYVNNTSITIDISGVIGAIQMQFKDEFGSFTPFEVFSPTKSWTLPSGDGVKKIFIKFKDIGGNTTDGLFFVSTTLDTSAIPLVSIETYTDESATTSIVSSTYQEVASPFFRWRIPVTVTPLKGFAYDIDGIPGSTVNYELTTLIRNGLEVTKAVPNPEMTLDISSGNYYYETNLRETVDETLLLANGGANDRIDVIYIEGLNGTPHIQEGIESVAPVVPEIDIYTDVVILAEVYVPSGTTLISNTTITDRRDIYVNINKWINEPLDSGQHVVKVKSINFNEQESALSTFDIWVQSSLLSIGELDGYTNASKTVSITSGTFQTLSSSVFLEWTSALSQPGPINYHYTTDGNDPTTLDPFTTNLNITLGTFSPGSITIKIKPFDATTGVTGDTKIFNFIYGLTAFIDPVTFDNDTAVISGGTSLIQSSKEVQVKSISWDFNSARICKIFQPVAFDASLPFQEGKDISVVHGSTTIFFGFIKQIERTISIGQEGVMYHCTGPRAELNEEYAYTNDPLLGETSRISFEDVDLTTAINDITSKFPNIVKKIDSYPTGTNITDTFVGQPVSNVLDRIFSLTKFGWYMTPSGSLVSVDTTNSNPGQAKFGIYGTTVNSLTPQYNVMSANLQFDVTNRYDRVVVEGARKKIRQSVALRCTNDTEIGEIVPEDNSDTKIKYKYYTYDSKWNIIKLLHTDVTYARILFYDSIFWDNGYYMDIVSSKTCQNNKVTVNTKEYGEVVSRDADVDGNAIGQKTVAVSPSWQSDEEIQPQGSLGNNNVIIFPKPVYSFWVYGLALDARSWRSGFSKKRNPAGGSPWASSYITTPSKTPTESCASITADVILETEPLRTEVQVSGTASGIAKTLRIVNNDFKYSEDPDNLADDTIKMQNFANDVLQKFKDIKIQGNIVLDTIDTSWELDKTVNLINTDQGAWSSLNAKVVGIVLNFDENTTTLEITTEFLK